MPEIPVQALQAALDSALGADTTLDSARIRTGLMIMTKRLDTGSPWPLNNGGRGRYAAQDGALRLDADRPRQHGRADLFRAGGVADFTRATARSSMANSSTAASAPSTIRRCSF